MPPNVPPNPSSSPADLPAVPLNTPMAPASQTVPVAPAAVAPAAGGQAAGQQALEQAKQLVLQYQNSPYQLAELLRQLKISYLADKFHITTNSNEN